MSAKGRVALVTGAAGGIGSAWCRMLLDDGASLAFVDVDGVRLESARWSLRVKYTLDQNCYRFKLICPIPRPAQQWWQRLSRRWGQWIS